ncbi:dephospho-CoA kinase [candidate division KSB3 bacterium]|nr:MAG: dephospho-CoA kinase [candidate division KSB3 bacterium]
MHPETVALTGGIASGKSTVSRMFQELGACLIDADIAARHVVAPGKAALQEIVECFGHDLLLENGRLDRQKLGRLIFNDPEKRRIVNRIVHPRVIQRISEQERACHEAAPERLIIADVPLLIESSMHTSCHTIILVDVPEPVQRQRLMQRDKLSEQDAVLRIHSQMPLAEKRRYATHIIHNDKSLVHTRQQVCTLYEALLKHRKDTRGVF